MTIKQYIEELEQIKQKLLDLNLPENTEMTSPPDMGGIRKLTPMITRFEPKKVFKLNDAYCLYKYVAGEELTETETVVIVSKSYSRY